MTTTTPPSSTNSNHSTKSSSSDRRQTDEIIHLGFLALLERKRPLWKQIDHDVLERIIGRPWSKLGGTKFHNNKPQDPDPCIRLEYLVKVHYERARNSFLIPIKRRQSFQLLEKLLGKADLAYQRKKKKLLQQELSSTELASNTKTTTTRNESDTAKTTTTTESQQQQQQQTSERNSTEVVELQENNGADGTQRKNPPSSSSLPVVNAAAAARQVGENANDSDVSKSSSHTISGQNKRKQAPLTTPLESFEDLSQRKKAPPPSVESFEDLSQRKKAPPLSAESFEDLSQRKKAPLLSAESFEDLSQRKKAPPLSVESFEDLSQRKKAPPVVWNPVPVEALMTRANADAAATYPQALEATPVTQKVVAAEQQHASVARLPASSNNTTTSQQQQTNRSLNIEQEFLPPPSNKHHHASPPPALMQGGGGINNKRIDTQPAQQHLNHQATSATASGGGGGGGSSSSGRSTVLHHPMQANNTHIDLQRRHATQQDSNRQIEVRQHHRHHQQQQHHHQQQQQQQQQQRHYQHQQRSEHATASTTPFLGRERKLWFSKDKEKLACTLEARETIQLTYRPEELYQQVQRRIMFRLMKWEPYWNLQVPIVFMEQTTKPVVVGDTSTIIPLATHVLSKRFKLTDNQIQQLGGIQKFGKPRSDDNKIPEDGEVRLLLQMLPLKQPRPMSGKRKPADYHMWPMGTYIQIDGKGQYLVQRKQQRHNPKKWLGLCESLDLMPLIENPKLDITLDLLHAENQSYVATLALCKYKSPKHLYEAMEPVRVSYEDGLEMAKKRIEEKSKDTIALDVFDDDENTSQHDNNSMTFKLICPISFDPRGMTTPVRSKYCEHFNCFDLYSYLESNKKPRIGGRWECPVCNKKHAAMNDLQICEFTRHVIQQCSQDLSGSRQTVELFADGRWELRREKKKRYGKGTLSSDKQQQEQQQVMTTIIDDDDDDEVVVQKAVSKSSSTTMNSTAAKNYATTATIEKQQQPMDQNIDSQTTNMTRARQEEDLLDQL